MKWIDYRSSRPLCFGRTSINAIAENTVVSLSENEKESILDYALSVNENPYVPNEQEGFIEKTKKIKFLLKPETLKKIILEIDEKKGFVLLENLPTDPDLPETPVTGGSLPPNYKHTFVSEALLVAFGSVTGSEPFNFRQEGRGTAPVFENIVPIPEMKMQRGAGGYENNFPFHCEVAWHRKRPDYLVLLGLRKAADAGTLVFSSNSLVSFKELNKINELQGRFRLKAPEIHLQMERKGMPLGTDIFREISPIEFDGKNFRLNINFNGIECLGEDALDWLTNFEEFIECNCVGTILSSSNALIINNHLTCHTRTGYNPSFNENDRWFLRGYFKNNLWLNDEVIESDNSMFDASEISQLVNLGWLKNARLTRSFLKFVTNPGELSKLENNYIELAAKAYCLTPIFGSRII